LIILTHPLITLSLTSLSNFILHSLPIFLSCLIRPPAPEVTIRLYSTVKVVTCGHCNHLTVLQPVLEEQSTIPPVNTMSSILRQYIPIPILNPSRIFDAPTVQSLDLFLSLFFGLLVIIHHTSGLTPLPILLIKLQTQPIIEPTCILLLRWYHFGIILYLLGYLGEIFHSPADQPPTLHLYGTGVVHPGCYLIH